MKNYFCFKKKYYEKYIKNTYFHIYDTPNLEDTKTDDCIK